MTDIDTERERIAQIVQLPYPERLERVMDLLARAWAQGVMQDQHYMAGHAEVNLTNPYQSTPRRVEDVPGNE